MSAAYLDTSAAMKLVVKEDESAALAGHLNAEVGLDLVASWLLYTELQCAIGKSPHEIDRVQADELIQRISLVDLIRKDLIAADEGEYGLRSNDAIHFAVAVRLGVGQVPTYDTELAQAARSAGIEVLAPA